MKVRDLVSDARKTIVDSVDDLAELIDGVAAAVTDSELLDSVPFVGATVKTIKAADRFTELRFRRNCAALLEACKAANREQRGRLWEMLSEEGKQEDFTDSLLLIALDSSKPAKAAIVGNLMAALCRERITYRQYDLLLHIVHSASIPALEALKYWFMKGAKGAGTPPEEPFLLSLGVGVRYGNRFTVNELGAILFEVGMKGKRPNTLTEMWDGQAGDMFT